MNAGAFNLPTVFLFSDTQIVNETFLDDINNILNIIPKWEFVAENAAGQAILNDPSKVQEQSNLITFNQRYDITTYDGSHFSQLGTMFNLSMNYRF